MTNLNSILPKKESLEEKINEEVAKILNFVKNEIKRNPDECKIRSIQNSENWEVKGNEPYLFNMDAIYKAIPYIKASDYYCWIYSDYKNRLSLWITKRNICPHCWYDQI